jgi:hypothetical protein
MDNSKDKLIDLLVSRLNSKGLRDKAHSDRLKAEIHEIDVQAEYDYFLDLYQRGLRFERNENNLLTSYLLDLVPSFDINKEAEFIYGDFPDVDVDYASPEIQKHLKDDWAPKTFGRQNVCNIGNYTTFGIRSSLIDMTRLFDEDRNEMLGITKSLGKDDDGKALTWESALAINKELREFCAGHAELADATRRLIGRNRGRGKHAGGLVISSKAIDELVPLITDSDGNPVSAWTEGQHDQDLQPVGLIKFDVLVVKDLLRIASCVNLIKERYHLSSICSKDGSSDWSDTSYLNDPVAIALANAGKTKGVFQFDSDGMRELLKKGGVDSFEDLAAYSALYRPAALGMGMHERYIDRKRGREIDWEKAIPNQIKPILMKTYGVMVYQEQVMKILNVVGDIPLIHCEKIRKAISKKNEKFFGKYKQMFIENGQNNLGWSHEQVANLWDQVEAFSGYGFNRSILKGTLVPVCLPDGSYSEKQIQDFSQGDKIFSVDEHGKYVVSDVIGLHDHGFLPAYKVVFDDGYSVTCTLNHKFLTKQGQKSLREIIGSNSLVLCGSHYIQERKNEKEKEKNGRWVDSSMRKEFSESKSVPNTRKIMSRMSRSLFYNGRLDGEVWREIYKQKSCGKASAKVRQMSLFGLENRRSGRTSICNRTQSSVWTGISDVEIAGRTSQNLSSMQYNQENEHYIQKSKTQSVAITTAGVVQSCKNYIGTSRNSKSTFGAIAYLEGSQPGEICEMCRSYVEKSEAVQNGNLAENSIGLGYVSNTMWGNPETSRFCRWENMDRSRWLLPLLSVQTNEETKKFGIGASKRRNVESRGDSKEGRDANSHINGMLRFFNGSDEAGVVDFVSEHAPIADTGRLVSRKVIRVVSVGKRQMYDLEVACSTHNFLLPNGVVTSNSHAVAYTFTSSRLLWLKAHYPLEFYAITLGLEPKETKICSYKREAEKVGIKVNRIDINKSKENFSIVDGEIFFGFQNIKQVGEEVAKRIVAGQPYVDLEDFLNRFGTDAKALTALIELGAFSGDRAFNKLFYEHFKEETKKRNERTKRNYKTRDKYLQQIVNLTESEVTHEYLESVSEEDINAKYGQDIWGVVKKYQKCVQTFNFKESKSESLTLANFDPEKLLEVPDVFDAEKLHYGFCWEHPLEKSPDYSDSEKFTFGYFDDNEWVEASMVEVMVVKRPEMKQSKKGHNYHYIGVEDADRAYKLVTIWDNDYQRFREEFEFWDEKLKRGHLFKLRVVRPGPGFSSYTFQSYSRRNLREMPKDKKDDHRLIVMAPPNEIL